MIWMGFWVFVILCIAFGVGIGKKWTKRRRVKLPYLKRAWIEQAALLAIQVRKCE